MLNNLKCQHNLHTMLPCITVQNIYIIVIVLRPVTDQIVPCDQINVLKLLPEIIYILHKLITKRTLCSLIQLGSFFGS